MMTCPVCLGYGAWHRADGRPGWPGEDTIACGYCGGTGKTDYLRPGDFTYDPTFGPSITFEMIDRIGRFEEDHEGP